MSLPCATWEEYYKLLSLFIQGLAKTKGISIEAAQEIVATEVKAIQTLIDINRVKAAAQQKESEQIFKAILYLVASITALVILGVIFNSIRETVTQRFLNTQEFELLRSENQQLRQENDTFKSELDKFKQFQQERKNLENLKAENEALRQKNSNLNERLVQCKKPFWERNCN
ncbi:hypothetical protein [Nostoc sp. CALU 1950]|uniref:hypothetical protein n=1 Tax=Nostoc sp. CALU 1950 TaxID=3104321 RepID=UPI003EB75AB3